MKRSGQGVLPHDGNTEKTIVSGILALLTSGDKKRFKEELQDIREKASQDPVHYSGTSSDAQSCKSRARSLVFQSRK
jgi:hypothetical protein